MTPIAFQWDGESMVPLKRFQRLCDKQYVIGEVYPLVPTEERSRATHNHYFASLHDAWLNLPEEIASDFPTEEHLRKYALIKAGFCKKREAVFSSVDDALFAAAIVKPADEYAVVEVLGRVLRVYTAKSQSMREMGKEDFQASKQAVLDVVAGMVGVSPDDLATSAGKAA
jgi:hypothetical protein